MDPVYHEYEQHEQLPEEKEQKSYALPFADNPYELPCGEIYEKPRKVRKKKERKEWDGTGTLALCLAVTVLVAALSSALTAGLLNKKWEARYAALSLSLQEKSAVLQAQINDSSAPAAVPGGSPVTGDLTPGQVYEQNVDAVVAITAYIEERDYYGQSFGSGFIITADGYVVSNYHVVEGASDVEVTTTAGLVYEATLVGYDSTNDLALLKVQAQDLPCVTLGSSDALQVGDQVAAIGNALGELTSTMTVGYVSAKDRVVTTDGSTINMIQTDAAINSGNSGGPLFNMQGEVVGITTAKFSGTSSSGVTIEGIGFAIPMDDVIGMIEDLRDLGYISGAYLGVMVMDVDPVAQTYGLPAGAFVDEVTPGYAAEAAGMLAEDIIVDLGGYPISSVTELTRMLRKFEPGETVSVTVYRGGNYFQLQVTLDEKPREQTAQVEPDDFLMPGDEGFEEWYRDFVEDFFG